MESKKYRVAIDLGESNVVVVVGSKSQGDLISIDSVVSRPCEGVKGGLIDNIALVEDAIKDAVTETEKSLNIIITEAYAGISGEFVRFACHGDHVYVTDPQNGVGKGDVDALFERMKHVQAPDNETIMERIPQNYIVDDSKEVKNPVGSFGRRLSSTFNFILCANTPMQRLENALRRLGIKLLRSYPNALAISDSVLSSDEKEEGVVLVDIGGGLTDLTIYYRNVVRYIVSIPMGSTAINHDIRSMMIPEKYIEKLKCEYGSAVADLVPEGKGVRVNGRTPRETKEILLYNLAVAIEARMSQLVEFVKREIKDSGYQERLPYGIVLTGGAAKLKNIDELFRRMTDMEIRIGHPVESLCEESLEIIASPEYATAVGILIRGMKQDKYTADPTPTIEPVKVQQTAVVVDNPPQEPSIKKPVVNSKVEIYTPPKPRPYTPPKPIVHTEAEPHVEQPKPEEPKPTQPSVDSEVVESDNGSFTPAQASAESQSGSAESEVKRPKRDWGSMLKKAFDKISDGFDAADDEEI